MTQTCKQISWTCQWGSPQSSFAIVAFISLSMLMVGCEPNEPKVTKAQPTEAARTSSGKISKNSSSSSEDRQEVRLGERSCSENTDCLLVDASCCSCRAGGAKTAIHREFHEGLKQRRLKACENVMCPQIMNVVPSCMATAAKCVDGQCVPDVVPPHFPGKRAPFPKGVGVEKIKTP